MAGRKDKNTVDYFPHYVNHGKTLFIIESKFGNDGYAAWFKILETLGSSEHHYIDCRKDEDWEFLNAKIKLMHTSLQEVLDLCAKLGAINKTLWENKVIWSENFVKNISDAYRRRATKCPDISDIVDIIGIDVNINSNNDGKKTQSILKKSKEDNNDKKIEARAKEFYKSIAEYKDKYTKDTLRDFYDYWTEPNKSKTKMRFELQNTWDLNLRLQRWARKDGTFTSNGTPKKEHEPGANIPRLDKYANKI
jgi:hypothetical protein